MGYKSFIRSVGAASNRVARENERRQRLQRKEVEKLQKKVANLSDKNEKIIDALEDIYAKGQIKKEEYERLKERQQDITMDLLVIGKTPGISLAKRYITGKIDKEEFEQIKKDLLPAELYAERELIEQNVNKIIEELRSFRSSCKQIVDSCQFCGKKKSFFSSLKKIEELLLCTKCQENLEALKNYKGFVGNYFEVKPINICFEEIDNKSVKVVVNLKQTLL